MCGIVGTTGRYEATPFLIDGLRTLEYRGYDSAGVAVISPEGEMQRTRRQGKVACLAQSLDDDMLYGNTGIAHTRWATHGAPSEANAHPQMDCTGKIAVVHNGIVENWRQLKNDLIASGHIFTSETDTEVVAHVLEEEYAAQGEDHDLMAALRSTCSRLEGSYALAVIHSDYPNMLALARNNSPLVCASTPEGAYAASDLLALVSKTRDIITLDNEQFAQLSSDGSVEVTDKFGYVVEPEIMHVHWDISAVDAGDYPDFMLKEIFEQPNVVRHTLDNRFSNGRINLDELSLSEEELKNIDRIFIVACGTSYHAGLIAKHMIEEWARIPVEVEVASEFNSRNAIVTPNTLCIIITQSGETADTLAAARLVKKKGARVFAVTNVIGSTAARESDGVVYIKAGPEVSVASTKAYVGMVTASILLALFFAQRKGVMTDEEVALHFAELSQVPAALQKVLDRANESASAATSCVNATSALFLGRGINTATAAEGALKLKEISYLHAEHYAAGEMKHGPLALVDTGFPVIVVVPNDDLRAKTLSNISEAVARGAMVIAVATDGDAEVASVSEHVMWIPEAPWYITPILSIAALQLFAREIALERGKNVDKPRNLAKSVTTE